MVTLVIQTLDTIRLLRCSFFFSHCNIGREDRDAHDSAIRFSRFNHVLILTDKKIYISEASNNHEKYSEFRRQNTFHILKEHLASSRASCVRCMQRYFVMPNWSRGKCFVTVRSSLFLFMFMERVFMFMERAK